MSTDDWATDPDTEARLYKFNHGPADLDPCSNDRSIVRARRRYVAGGLHLRWLGRKIYVNNPYSEMMAWTDKLLAELAIRRRGEQREIVWLPPCATSTEWWAKALRAEPLIGFPRRLAFLNEEGLPQGGCRFDSAYFLFGATAAREREFRRCFDDMVRWWVKVTPDMLPAITERGRRRRAA